MEKLWIVGGLRARMFSSVAGGGLEGALRMRVGFFVLRGSVLASGGLN